MRADPIRGHGRNVAESQIALVARRRAVHFHAERNRRERPNPRALGRTTSEIMLQDAVPVPPGFLHQVRRSTFVNPSVFPV